MAIILIVDDDPSILEILSLFLHEVGYHTIITATNGQIAIDKIHQSAEKPDIIIMDYRMPIKNGLDTSLEIIKLGYTSKIILASADFSIRKKALEAGVFMFIGKPFIFKDLLDIIMQILKRNNNG